VYGNSQLFEIVAATHSISRLADLLDGWYQQAYQHSDYRNDNK
jgi:hypothetical protein